MTPDEINALPERVRQYIHDLETNADPAGTIQENALLKDQTRELDAVIARLKKERDMFKAQVETFRKNQPRLMRKTTDGELVPVDAGSIGEFLPMFMDALGAQMAGRDFASTVEQLSKAKDMTDIQKFVMGFLQQPAGADMDFEAISKQLKQVLAKTPAEKVTRYRQTHCAHDGQKCSYDCEPGECYREQDAS